MSSKDKDKALIDNRALALDIVNAATKEEQITLMHQLATNLRGLFDDGIVVIVDARRGEYATAYRLEDNWHSEEFFTTTAHVQRTKYDDEVYDHSIKPLLAADAPRSDYPYYLVIDDGVKIITDTGSGHLPFLIVRPTRTSTEH